MMRIVDGFVAIPTVLLVLLLATIVTPSVATLILILGFVSWLITARLVRSEVLVLRTLDYVKAAEMIGERPSRSCTVTSSATSSGLLRCNRRSRWPMPSFSWPP